MKEYFIIQRLQDGAFFSESYQAFKGILYATKYNTNAAAYTGMMNIVPGIPCTIIKAYEN